MRKETLNIDFNKKIFKAKLTGIGFMEGNSHIVYLPSLQISAYGDSIEEANDMIAKSYKILEPFSERVYSIIKMDIRKGAVNRISGKIKSVENIIGKVNS